MSRCIPAPKTVAIVKGAFANDPGACRVIKM